MRVFILENCVVDGSVWFGGEEVYVDEVLGKKMVAEGKAREMQIYHGDTENTESLRVEMRVIKAKERAVGPRQRNRRGSQRALGENGGNDGT